ncbi:MAG: type II secretion system F family protein [Nitrospirae bacterium]|nr:type II secretion system F family protein [Nitrospirota bacterium]
MAEAAGYNRSVAGQSRYSIRLAESHQFFTRLAAMYKSGIPLEESLAEIAGGTGGGGRSIAFEAAITRVINGLHRGVSLSAALYGEGLVDTLQVRLVEVGQKSGNLEFVFSAIASDAQRRITLRRTVIGRLAYPVLLIPAAILLIPLSTLVSSGFGAYFKAAILPLIELSGIGAGIIYLLRFMGKRGANRIYRDRLLLSIPILGRWVRNMSWARFCRAFALSYGAGLEMRETVRLAISVMGNHAMQEENMGAVNTVDSGRPLSYFFRASKTTPHIITDMLGTGEQTGNLDEMTNSAANHFEELSERQLVVLTTVLYAMVFVSVSIYIAYKVITFYTNLFKMEMSL